MITLAVLFVVDQVVKNWQELTRGAGGLSGVPAARDEHVAVGRRARRARSSSSLFRETRVGRFAIATREDEIAAPAIGIDLFWPRWTAWVVSIAVVGRRRRPARAGGRQHQPEAVHARHRRAAAGDARRRRHAHRHRRVRRHRARHRRQRGRPPDRRPPRDRPPARAVPQRRAARRDAAAARRPARRPRRRRRGCAGAGPTAPRPTDAVGRRCVRDDGAGRRRASTCASAGSSRSTAPACASSRARSSG